MKEIHTRIVELRDPGIELFLLRHCADICKIVHLLRAKGPRIAETSLQDFDENIRGCLEKILCGKIHEEAYVQSTLGVKESGLGLRRSIDLALPAAISSRIQARPVIRELVAHDLAEILPENLLERFDQCRH